jgi:hypothetical protein
MTYITCFFMNYWLTYRLSGAIAVTEAFLSLDSRICNFPNASISSFKLSYFGGYYLFFWDLSAYNSLISSNFFYIYQYVTSSTLTFNTPTNFKLTLLRQWKSGRYLWVVSATLRIRA